MSATQNAHDALDALTYTSDRAGRAEHRAAVARIDAQFKADLAREYLPGMPPVVTNKVFAKAWEDAHSDGYRRVESMYEDLADIVETVAQAAATDSLVV